MEIVAETSYPRFLPVGDMALTVEFGNAIDATLNAKVMALDLAVAASELPGIIETMPAYRSLLVCYDPAEISLATLTDHLTFLMQDAVTSQQRGRRVWTVPVAYGGEYGDDLEEAAERLGLTAQQVTDLHSSAEYLVYLVGFNPGAPNLGGLPKPLHILRRALPRAMIPPGSVAIGGMQSGITSIPSPTGWYVLGRTPVRPFQADRPDPFLFQPGDYIRFRSIQPDEFVELELAASRNTPVATLEMQP